MEAQGVPGRYFSGFLFAATRPFLGKPYSGERGEAREGEYMKLINPSMRIKNMKVHCMSWLSLQWDKKCLPTFQGLFRQYALFLKKRIRKGGKHKDDPQN